MKLSVIMPVYNEVTTIGEIVQRVQSVDIDKEIIVVDDYSTDGTRDILRDIEGENSGVSVLYHDLNRGKGRALRTGFAAAQGDYVLIQDADLEYDPEDYAKLIHPLDQEKRTPSTARASSRHRSTGSSIFGIPWETST